ncbi:pentatricopeptide repeat-containing protein At4g21065-like [Mercurialis annua]|uniref:pentatricopeptide repeat-containing protein At4g21065-like n=1 Tax=Mercurialis annua TaxID=3986 RepID=UPI002160E2AC|nr:pentatricopeptide repeat-containing protein At4g21065-like [Mercurialis annua]
MTIYNLITRLKPNIQTHILLQNKTKISLLQSKLSQFSLHSTTSSTNANPKSISLSKEEFLMSHLKKCSTMKDLKQLHSSVIQSGFEQNLFVIGKVIAFCAVSDHGDMNYAVSVFESVENPDGFLWNTMIRGFGKINESVIAFEYYKRMQEKKLVADNFTFSFLVKICGQMGSVWLGKQMHCCVLKHGFESHVFVRNSLIHMYGVFKEFVIARQLFDEMPSPELVAWNSIIGCCVDCGEFKEAIGLFSRMLSCGVEPDEATIVVVLAACSVLGELNFGRWVHSLVSNSSLGSLVEVSNSVIDMYAKCGAVEEAHETFNRMIERNVITWNTMILGLATHGHTNEALVLFSKMLEQHLFKPDGITFLGILCACSHGGMVDQGRRFFDVMSKEYQIQPTIKHYGCMVDILGRAGFVEEAYGLVRSMPMECNAIIWRTLLAACKLHGNVEVGEKVRRHILEVEPDHSSDYVLVSSMYAGIGQWNQVMVVRESMQKRGIHKPEPGNSFIGMQPNLLNL